MLKITKWQMLGSIFNSFNFSRNFTTCGFLFCFVVVVVVVVVVAFASQASFYTRVNFSITITPIDSGFK